MRSPCRGATRRVIATVAITPAGSTWCSRAHATTEDCERAIAREASKLGKATAKTLAVCEDKKLKGAVSPSADCRSELVTAAKLLKARSKFEKAVPKACGGANQICDPADSGADADDSVAAVGWGIAQCPGIAGGDCVNAITDCDDVVTCLECVADAAVSHPLSFVFDVAAAAPKSDLLTCQRALGKATTKDFAARAKALQTCEDKILNDKIDGPCPDPGDGKTLAAIAKAETKKVAAICKACGGADKACGGGDDLLPADLGLASTCPAVTRPGGASCEAPVDALMALVACVDCVADFATDCLDAIGAAAVKPYLVECNAAPQATPTRTATPASTATRTATPASTATRTSTPASTSTRTPTPALTPTRTATPGPSVTATPSGAVCGNGVTEAGENCDDGNTLNCDACPANCHTQVPACTTDATRFTQTVRVTAPQDMQLTGAQLCLEYPNASVSLPGTGQVTSRVSGFSGISTLNDFNNAVLVSLAASSGQPQFQFTISFDHCIVGGNPVPAPPPSVFVCVMRQATNDEGSLIQPPSLVDCQAVAP